MHGILQLKKLKMLLRFNYMQSQKYVDFHLLIQMVVWGRIFSVKSCLQKLYTEYVISIMRCYWLIIEITKIATTFATDLMNFEKIL